MTDFSDHIEADTIRVNTLLARQVEIVDKDNKARISMYIGDNSDNPIIALHDSAQRDRVYVTLDENERGLITITGDDESHRTSIGLDDDDWPEVRLSDRAGELRASLYVCEDRPEFVMYDANEKIRISLFLEDDGKPYIMFYNAEEQSQVKVTVADDGSECLILEDKEGEETRIPLQAPREL